ncbi:hypothetical protein ACFV94_18015 [Streptomyces sp. NPDC059896]|uniref:hypothetical protein n=1 Tax=Streptomyces sp. NPDC059896 TaxID=3346993 RepID=UPI0036689828
MFGETGGEGDGAGGGTVTGDLRGVPVAGGDTQAGQQPLACFTPERGKQTLRSGVRLVEAQFDAHGQVPEHRGHDGADEGPHRAADRTGLGVRRDDLHPGDHPDQAPGQTGCALGVEVLPGHQRGGEQGQFRGAEHHGPLHGPRHVEIVGGEAPARVGAVGSAADRGERRDLYRRPARPTLALCGTPLAGPSRCREGDHAGDRDPYREKRGQVGDRTG